MRRTLIGGGVLVVVVGFCAAAAAGAIAWQRLHEPYLSGAADERFIDVPQGAATNTIGVALTDAGVVRDSLTFRLALWWTDNARRLQAGEYRFTEPASPIAVIERLAIGDVHRRSITFPEGLTMWEQAALFEARGFGTDDAFLTAARDGSLVADVDPSATDLEGYLFPDTYALPRNTPATDLIRMMVDRFHEVFTDDLRAAAVAQNLTTREVVTLASLVEKETGQDEERALVAAVYRNRLRIGMLMQADPTVIYALQLVGDYDGNIRRVDLEMDSPYNTYRYAGLPPGPIASPGGASLRATLAPAEVPFLYFVSRNDGSHAFARTLAEHNRNVREFQIDFFRRQRAAAQQSAP